MIRSAIVTSLMAVITSARASQVVIADFTYVGCVAANPTSFGVDIAFFAPFRADQCWRACDTGAAYAALGSGCHCSEPTSRSPVAFDDLDESMCSVLCIDGDDAAGHCGGPPQDGDKQLFNLYKRHVDAVETGSCGSHRS